MSRPSLLDRLGQAMTDRAIEPSGIPAPPIESALDREDLQSMAAYIMHADEIGRQDAARRQIAAALVGGTIGLLTLMFKAPELWKLLMACGLAGTLICAQLEAARCRTSVKHGNIACRIEDEVPNAWAKFYRHLDLDFRWYKLTKIEWICFLAFCAWMGVWAFQVKAI